MNVKPEIEITGIATNPIHVVLDDAEDIYQLANKKNVKRLAEQLLAKAQLTAGYRLLEKISVKYPYVYNFKPEVEESK